MKTMILLLACFPIFMINCASLSTLQDARTISPDSVQIYVNFSKHMASADSNYFFNSPVGCELGMRKSWVNRVEVTIAYATPIGLALAGRYLIFGQSGALASSIGIKSGINAIEGPDKQTTVVYDTSVPLYISYYPASWLAITGVPMYSLKTFTLDSGKWMHSLVGANINLKVGGRFGFFVEGGYFRDIKLKESVRQLSGALFFRL